MARAPLTMRQMDTLDTIMSRLDALIAKVKDRRILAHLDEAARRLSSASHDAQTLDP